MRLLKLSKTDTSRKATTDAQATRWASDRSAQPIVHGPRTREVSSFSEDKRLFLREVIHQRFTIRIFRQKRLFWELELKGSLKSTLCIVWSWTVRADRTRDGSGGYRSPLAWAGTFLASFSIPPCHLRHPLPAPGESEPGAARSDWQGALRGPSPSAVLAHGNTTVLGKTTVAFNSFSRCVSGRR